MGQLLLPTCIEESWVHFTCQWSYAQSADALQSLSICCLVMDSVTLSVPAIAQFTFESFGALSLLLTKWIVDFVQGHKMMKYFLCIVWNHRLENKRKPSNQHWSYMCVIHQINFFPHIYYRTALCPQLSGGLSLCSFWGVDLSRHVTEHLLAHMWLHLTVDPLQMVWL